MKRILLTALFALAAPAAALAQVGDTTQLPTGVSLGLIYQPGMAQGLAVRPFEAAGSGSIVAQQATEIVTRDLDFTDRFNVVSPPAGLVAGAIEYGPWNDLGVSYLVTGRIEPRGDIWALTVTVHDVTYGSVMDEKTYAVPAPADPRFRLAVHAISDGIVEKITGQPGMAATSIAFVRRSPNSYELMMVDYDGENLRRISSSSDILLSPAWTVDGARLAYSVVTDAGHYQIQERVLATGDVRILVDRPGLNITPAYSPDGTEVSFAIEAGAGTHLYRYDIRRDCCLERMEGGRGRQLSPTYSGDGRRIAFNSDRLGQPHIFVRPAEGGDAELISPFVYGEPGYYTSPDWSPTSSLVAFHGRSRGNFQIMVADADNPGALVRQVTADGVSEDPSWAPDGRHLIFTGRREAGRGLYVIDTSTGRLRPVVLGGDLLVPDWSPTLVRASALVLDGR
ncbi:MAG TPA: hypothetical protein VF039_12780 [Longimicrobiales bacterium]